MFSSKIGNKEFVYPNRKEFIHLKKEIFGENCYLPDGDSFVNIVDVGSYIGISSVYFAQRYPRSKVLAYEPNPMVHDYLKENCNEFQNIQIFEQAVTNNGGKVQFYLSNSDQSWFSNSSMLKSSWNDHIPTSKIEVESVSLNSVIKALGSPCLLKIDVEGYEKNLIREELELENVDELFIEYHSIGDGPLRKIIKMLRRKGYKVEFVHDGKSTIDTPQAKLFIIHATRPRS